MNMTKMSLMVVGLLVAVLGASFSKLAIEHRLSWQSVSDGAAKSALAPNKVPQKVLETHWRGKITFQEALQIAEAVNKGKAYSIERETEGGKPVIEVGIAGQEVFVDAESGEIVLTENIQQKGDREDTEQLRKAIELQQLAPIPIQEALQAAESVAGKQVHSIDLENKNGNLVYEVVVELQEVFIDAGNGQVLSTETVGQADNEDAAQVNSSIQVPSTHDDEENGQ
jgi:uncharacterized membrane protein YkoI